MPKDVEQLIRTASNAPVMARLDGSDRYVEGDLSQQWQVRAKLVLDVYDDLLATKDSSLLAEYAE
jgi:hypothetical protein